MFYRLYPILFLVFFHSVYYHFSPTINKNRIKSIRIHLEMLARRSEKFLGRNVDIYLIQCSFSQENCIQNRYFCCNANAIPITEFFLAYHSKSPELVSLIGNSHLELCQTNYIHACAYSLFFESDWIKFTLSRAYVCECVFAAGDFYFMNIFIVIGIVIKIIGVNVIISSYHRRRRLLLMLPMTILNIMSFVRMPYTYSLKFLS